MGWIFWKKDDVGNVVGVSPTAGGRLRKSIDVAKETLVSKNVRAYEQQRDAIFNAEKIAKMINNQIFSMHQFSNQIAEWTGAMKKTLDHVSKQSVLIEDLQAKFGEYKRTLGELQRLHGYQVPEGNVPARQVEFQKGEKSKLLAQAREAISKLNAELKSVKEDVDDLSAVASNLTRSRLPEGSRGAGGIPMLDNLARGLIDNAAQLTQVAKTVQDNTKQVYSAYAQLVAQLGEASEQLRVQIDQSELELVRTGP